MRGKWREKKGYIWNFIVDCMHIIFHIPAQMNIMCEKYKDELLLKQIDCSCDKPTAQIPYEFHSFLL